MDNNEYFPLKYSPTHVWLRVKGDIGVVGITEFAVNTLGFVTFVSLPELNKYYEIGENIAVIESSKTTTTIYSPVSGEVVAVNETLSADPLIVNQSPFEKGWLFRIKISKQEEIGQLLTHAQYSQKIEEESCVPPGIIDVRIQQR